MASGAVYGFGAGLPWMPMPGRFSPAQRMPTRSLGPGGVGASPRLEFGVASPPPVGKSFLLRVGTPA